MSTLLAKEEELLYYVIVDIATKNQLQTPSQYMSKQGLDQSSPEH